MYVFQAFKQNQIAAPCRTMLEPEANGKTCALTFQNILSYTKYVHFKKYSFILWTKKS